MVSYLHCNVAQLSNPGSYFKALGLLKEGAVSILIRCADGATEASVRSERGNDLYSVRLQSNGNDVASKCSCRDAKNRGGVCKHGAAVLLALQQEAKAPGWQPPEQKECGGTKETPPRVITASRLDRGSGQKALRRKRFAPGASGGSSDELDEVPEPATGMSAPALPRFPQQRQTRAGVLPAPPEKRQRRDSLKVGLMARMLKGHASSGNVAGFQAELRRWGEAPLDDASGLLHQALQGEQASAIIIAREILARPDGVKALNSIDGSGRTPLHTAVAHNRRGVCEFLLEQQADLNARDAAGRTALDIARSRRLDASLHQAEDPVVELLKQAASTKIRQSEPTESSGTDDLPIMEILGQASMSLA